MLVFPAGDYFLVDADGSGSFENDVFQSEACPFGPILYLGAKAYKVALAPDCKSLRVEPWTGTPGRSGVAAARRPGPEHHAGLGGPQRTIGSSSGPP